MKTTIIMPKLGLTMEEGTIVSWLKKVGDEVAQGEPLLQVETDKVIEEVASETGGVLVEITRAEGETVPVSEILGFLQTDGEEPQASPNALQGEGSRLDQMIAASRRGEKTESTAAASSNRTKESGSRQVRTGIRVSHRAANLADARGVDLSKLPAGSGPGGRIVEKDVLAWIQAPGSGEHPEIRTPSAVRRLVAERMTVSFSQVPHFYLSTEVLADGILAMRKALLPDVGKSHGVRLTITDFILKATAEALARQPQANVRWKDGTIELLREINIGLAVDTARGLIVPVIARTDGKSLAEIARERSELVETALQGKLSRDQVSGGTFTISNLGMFGVDRFQAIINPPQSAILAVGAIKDRPAVVKGKVVLKPTLFLTLSIDHRVLDGTDGARFLSELTELIENPESIAKIP